jgi:hypothetical protein
VGLARLEVDGPDSLVALAPALPQLVALTHLRASIGLKCVPPASDDYGLPGVFSARGALLEEVPCLQQLCPGIRSLHLYIILQDQEPDNSVDAPVAELLPHGLQQLHIHGTRATTEEPLLRCATLSPFTSLRRLALSNLTLVEPDLLLLMPALKEVDLFCGLCWVGKHMVMSKRWLTEGLCTAPQHLTKLTGCRLWGGAPVMTGVINLHKLDLALPGQDEPLRQQFLAWPSLRHLDLSGDGLYVQQPEAAAAALTLTSLRQLTYLHFDTSNASVPRTTWAAVLPHLTQLRVLAVNKEQLLEGGLVAEVLQLSQLQCLYAHKFVVGEWDPAAAGAEVAPHLPALSKCSSLKAVLCSGWSYGGQEPNPAQPIWEVVHGGRLHLSCWHMWWWASREGRVVCPRPCPHLPGVWELQQQEQPAT